MRVVGDRLRDVAGIAYASPAETTDDLVVGDRDERDDQRLRLRNFVEQLGLHDGARKAVEDEPGRRVGVREALAHEIDHERVADERAGRERGGDLTAKRGIRANGLAEDLAGRDARNAEPPGEPDGLGTLPGAGRTDQDQVDAHGG